ncbi:DUF1493 family protein [Acidovorax sp. SUPP3434]|uniref:DUF1493 family protein n=1 Tax=Acidovorax sp. SUPP3434 TaxID=2920880 RepID=UPI0023DE2156|nr:DUF1493 family protein [Acidovorax sp. SUPP3434]GKT00877.1 DUF1493 family protein [Acidovorax sp. SUPP3434]
MSFIAAVEAFARKESGVLPSRNLHSETTIEDDLSITGDDAVEFMETFFAEFGVDSSGFDFGRYFHNEGFNPLQLFWMPLRRYRDRQRKVPITLGMLAKSVELKRWDAARIESAGPRETATPRA